jgi:hypothetical protein
MIAIPSKKAVTNSCAFIVREFLSRPAPQFPLVGRRKAVKHRYVHSIAAVISSPIIFLANIVDAVIDAVAIGSTSTRGPTTSMRFHAPKTWVSLLHFDQIRLTTSKKNILRLFEVLHVLLAFADIDRHHRNMRTILTRENEGALSVIALGEGRLTSR